MPRTKRSNQITENTDILQTTVLKPCNTLDIGHAQSFTTHRFGEHRSLLMPPLCVDPL